jgi:hypothetical protein
MESQLRAFFGGTTVAEEPKPNFWPADNPAVIAHMNMLQAIINRLATQSSSCKTWCLSLVAALISFAGATKMPSIVTFALVPVVIFGFLDTMYLAQETAYRDLFNSVAASIRDGTYGKDRFFNASALHTEKYILQALGSWSIWPVYGGLIALYIIAHSTGWFTTFAIPVK